MMLKNVMSSIFPYMTDAPWTEAVEGSILDDLYFNKYGMREASALVINKLDENRELTEEALQDIADLFMAKYGTQLIKLYETLGFEYEPLSDMSYKETHSGKDTETRKPNLTDTTTDTQAKSRTYNNLTSEITGQVSADNSSSWSNESKDSNVQSGSYTDTVDSGTIAIQKTGTEDIDTTYGHIISKIGSNKSPQELIEEERALWDYNYFDKVFSYLNNLITRNYYPHKTLCKIYNYLEED